MAMVPVVTVITWTPGGVFVETDFAEDGPDPASKGRFVSAELDALQAYLRELWQIKVEKG